MISSFDIKLFKIRDFRFIYKSNLTTVHTSVAVQHFINSWYNFCNTCSYKILNIPLQSEIFSNRQTFANALSVQFFYFCNNLFFSSKPVFIGMTSKSMEEIKQMVKDMKAEPRWAMERYDLVRNNCHSFTNTLLEVSAL